MGAHGGKKKMAGPNRQVERWKQFAPAANSKDVRLPMAEPAQIRVIVAEPGIPTAVELVAKRIIAVTAVSVTAAIRMRAAEPIVAACVAVAIHIDAHT